MSPQEARQDAVNRFGDFQQIHKACRRTLLGERIMLQRLQAVLTVVLLGAVVFLGVEFYRGQRANEAATVQMMQILDNLVEPSVTQTVPKSGDNDVDPSLTEIRVTYNKQMMDGSWSWCYEPDQFKTTGKSRYEADGRTCVMPVKLEPGRTYTLSLNTDKYRNFKDTTGRSAVPYLLQFTTRQEATSNGGAKRQPSGPQAVDRHKGGVGAGGDAVPPHPSAVTPAHRECPHDAKLNEMQRLCRDTTEETFKELLYPPYVNRDSQKQCVELLSNGDEQVRIAAINALAIMASRKAVPGLLKIAAERVEKDNRDRWMAVRALGVIGDASVVPELVHLTYHYNQYTRFWAQISLVRLTGENFGRDVAAWKAWWEKQGKQPPISTETVAWATSPDLLQYTDPKRQDEFDRHLGKPGM
jgi:RNA polymerase sigma-70 factor (ECF subfamily)